MLLSILVANISIDDEYTLLISFDGFRHDYLSFTDTPNFDSFINSGVHSASLIPVFPSLTFPNHYSIATGYYSNNHKILGNSFYSKRLKKKYSMRDSETVQDGRFYGMEPIWVTAEKNNLKTAAYFWIGSEAEIKGYRPSIFKEYDGSVLFESRVDSIVKWFSYPEIKRPRISMLYFSEPDYTGHKHGTLTDEIVESVISMDKLLGVIMEKVSKLEIYSKLNIIIVSDHGMADTSTDRLIILDDYINMEYLDVNLSPTVTGLNLKKELVTMKPGTFIKEIKNAKIISKRNIPERYHYNNEDTPDYIVLADEGWFITTREKMKEGRSFPYGMHGYDPKSKNMHGIFMASGPSFKQNLRIKSIDNVNIYPIICQIHGLAPYKIDGIETYWETDIIKQIMH